MITRGINQIFTKSIIVMMMVLLCLPCSAKKEIKQALDIPVAMTGTKPDHHQNLICNVYPDQLVKKVSFSYKTKDCEANPTYYYDNFRWDINIAQYHKSSPEKEPFILSIPIYRLHEQYLI